LPFDPDIPLQSDELDEQPTPWIKNKPIFNRNVPNDLAGESIYRVTARDALKATIENKAMLGRRNPMETHRVTMLDSLFISWVKSALRELVSSGPLSLLSLAFQKEKKNSFLSND